VPARDVRHAYRSGKRCAHSFNNALVHRTDKRFDIQQREEESSFRPLGSFALETKHPLEHGFVHKTWAYFTKCGAYAAIKNSHGLTGEPVPHQHRENSQEENK